MSSRSGALAPWFPLVGLPAWAAALAGGALLPFAFAPFGLFVLAPLSFACLLVALEGQRPAMAARLGFGYGVASFLGGIYWVYISVHVFGGAPVPLALLLMLALVMFMASYVALFAWLLNRYFASGGARLALAAPALWMLVEWLRGWLFSGFGWLGLGYSQADSPLAGWAPVLGEYGLTLATALSGAALLALVSRRAQRMAAVVGIVLVWGAGAGLATVAWTTPAGAPLTASLVQGAVPQELKWLPSQLQSTVDLYVSLTDEHLDSDLIVWPEAAIPTARHNLDPLFAALSERGAQSNTDFLIGAVEIEAGTGRRLNGIVALDHRQPAVQRTYYKRHLVPFGEYFPVPAMVREWIRWMELPYEDFSPGDEHQAPLRVAGTEVGASICYEDVFGAELLDSVPDSGLLVNVSNDAWFGGSLAPHQHLEIARLRAREVGRPMLRATNTGISAVIGPRGELLAVSPQFQPHVLTARVQPYTGSTPYATAGNGPALGLATLMLLAAAWLVRARPSGPPVGN